MAILNDSVIVSARECGRLQGVAWAMLSHNLFHADSICAHINAIFLRKEFRKQGLAANGVKLVLKIVDAIKKRNVSKIYIYPNVLIPFGRLLKELGFKQEMEVWGLLVGKADKQNA
jgi:hypothetical protein